jgi:NAD(P)-dependent dehydrogenase (short-subunit alcohol dehydrogenase family)
MIAIGARSDLSETTQAIREAVNSVGKPEPKVVELKLDVTSRESVDAAAAEIKKAFGRIDIVVNNAGVFAGQGLIADTDPDAWWDVMAVNVKGPYLVMRALVPLMLEAGGLQTFVTVSSVGALCRTPSVSGYQTSKLAVLRLTEFLNAEYCDKGISAFSIHPGNIPTDMLYGPDGAVVPEELIQSKSRESGRACLLKCN